ncbi:MAG: XRE family transcriptional regulator [Terracidiphilus sp.]|nr:XRE family transcriptional regulator [Terracidiphilus sp.]MDR3797928.1 XRE family transcriptional regulator [Terracidiphilus sp.]
MTVSLEEVLNQMPEEERAEVFRRADEIRQEINLREMRRLRKLTQVRLSKKLKIGQEGVSRIEKRSDLYLSTLRDYVEGVGGKLSLVVEFPDRAPVVLSGFGEGSESSKPRKQAAKRGKRPARSKAGRRVAA